jgi:hypothetical protein
MRQHGTDEKKSWQHRYPAIQRIPGSVVGQSVYLTLEILQHTLAFVMFGKAPWPASKENGQGFILFHKSTEQLSGSGYVTKEIAGSEPISQTST